MKHQKNFSANPFEPEFQMNQQVRVAEHADTREGEIGIITAIYDQRFTPSRYPQGSEYRVTFNNNREDCGYFSEGELEPVKVLKAFAFKKLSNGEYSWFSDDKPRKGMQRVSRHDHSTVE